MIGRPYAPRLPQRLRIPCGRGPFGTAKPPLADGPSYACSAGVKDETVPPILSLRDGIRHPRSPAPPVAAQSLTRSSCVRGRVAVIKTETIIMHTIDQILELQAELHGCFPLTKAERAKAKIELAALITQQQAEARKFARDIQAVLADLA